MKSLSRQKREQLNFQVGKISSILFLPQAEQQIQSGQWSWNNYIDLISKLESIEKIESDIKNFAKSDRISRLEKFNVWAAENGAQCDGIKIEEYQDYDLGLKATRSIKKDEIFVNIPKKMLLSLENANNDMKMLFENFPNRGDFQLAMILIYEKLISDSYWKPYIDILPRKYSVPIFYSVQEMGAIKNTQAFLPALNQWRTTVMQYYYVYRYLHHVVKDTEMNPTVELLKDKFTFDLYRWAIGTIMTRQNTIPSFEKNGGTKPYGSDVHMIPALIPFWDMANHDPTGHISTYFNDESLAVESRAIKDFDKGDQMFIYYGSRTTTEMLVNNGFFSPSGDLTLWFHLPGGETDYRKPLCVRAGFDSNSISLPISRTSNYITPKFLAAHRIFVMNQEMVDEWLAKEDISELFSFDFKFADAILEKKLWQTILIRLKVIVAMNDSKNSAAPLTEEMNGLNVSAPNRSSGKGRIIRMLGEFCRTELTSFTSARDYVEDFIKKNV